MCERIQVPVLENANHIFAELIGRSEAAENIIDYLGEVQLVYSDISSSLKPIEDSDLFAGFQSLSSILEVSLSTLHNGSSPAIPASSLSTSYILSRFDRRCYSIYYRTLPLVYYLKCLVSDHPELTPFYKQFSRLAIVSLLKYDYL